MLCEDWLGYSRLEVALNHSEEIASETQEKFQNAVSRLKSFEPIQYIIGQTDFYGFSIKVTPDTLIPRPETEELVAWILNAEKDFQKILDIGTGSGCIAIALAKNLSESSISAMDNSVEALKVAYRNALDNDVEIRFIEQDILNSSALPSTYSMIVSNPPYVRESEKKDMHSNVLDHEPGSALYVSDHDPFIFYRKIAQLAAKDLEEDGLLFFEINEYLSKELEELISTLGFQEIEIRKDLRGKDRMLKCKKGEAIK